MTVPLKITVMGCGSSHGVPAAGGFWGDCDPKEPRNQRSRASIMVQSQTTNLVVDTTYDFRTQMNREVVQRLDGVLISHSHSDHINGIDDLRTLSYKNHKRIPLYTNQQTVDEIARRWPYLIKPQHAAIYSEFIEPHVIGHYERFKVGDIGVESFEQDHTVMKSLGFRFGNFAYSVDVADLSRKALDALYGVDTWIVDGGSYHRDHVTTHANLRRVYDWVAILKPRMTYLTVLSGQMDYNTLCGELPAHIRPAHDGMVIEASGF
jgi:phosphoribosyl 1,2-cyclic phosphate phosphodiesterase